MVLQHNNTQCVTHYRYDRWEQVAKLAYLYGPTAQQHSVLSHIIMQYMQSTLLFYQFCPCIHLSDAGTVSKRMDILSTLFSHSSRGIILVFFKADSHFKIPCSHRWPNDPYRLQWPWPTLKGGIRSVKCFWRISNSVHQLCWLCVHVAIFQFSECQLLWTTGRKL